MIKYIFFVIMFLFILGGILIYVINRNKTDSTKKENWIKFISYFLIVNLIIACIIYSHGYFYYVAIIISLIGLIEISRAIYYSRKYVTGFKTLLIYIPLVIVFIQFTDLKQNILLYTYIVVTIFDAFSQLSGQLFGKTKLVPAISPNKTWEGFIGGLASTCLIAVLFFRLIDISVIQTIMFSFSISIFSFFGDLLASLCKRKFNIKDFGKILPGQGGILDRFDSLIFSSLIVSILNAYNFL